MPKGAREQWKEVILRLGTSNENELHCGEENDILDRHGVRERGKQGSQTRGKDTEIPATMLRAARTRNEKKLKEGMGKTFNYGNDKKCM